MPPSSSASPAVADPGRPEGTSGPLPRLLPRPAFTGHPLTRLTLWSGVVVVCALWAWGVWQRRWIADDGLIVLRTIRNLLAGNGPVFNIDGPPSSRSFRPW